MKGLQSLRFGMPNIQRLRSRLNNAPKELSKEIRTELGNIIVEVLNKSELDIKARLIAYIESRKDLEFKDAKAKASALSLFSGIYDVCFASDAAGLNALMGDTKDGDDSEKSEGDEPEGDTTEENPDETKAEGDKDEEEFD